MNIVMTAESHRHLPLGGTFNVRDLGGYDLAGGGTTQWRRVLRADALHRLDEPGRARLRGEGLRTVIDLRFDQEVASAASPFSADEEVAVVRIPLFAKMGSALAELHGRDSADPLAALYAVALENCREAIGDAVTAVAESPEGMVLFHCTAGKDRTGLVAALILLSVGVPPETVEEDYALTTRFAEPMFATLIADAKARGDDVERLVRYLPSEAATMRATLDHLAVRYGGAAAYLNHSGVDSERLRRLQRRLVGA